MRKTQKQLNIIQKQKQVKQQIKGLYKYTLNEEILKTSRITKIENIDIYSPHQLYQTQTTYIRYILSNMLKKCHSIIQSPTGTGKTTSLLASTLSYQYHLMKCSSLYIPQIIYTSRTHQQLKQVVEELKNFPFNVNMTVLSSREQTCVNVDLKELKGKDKGFQCRKRVINTNQQGKTCTFYKNQHQLSDIADSLKGKIMDLQEITLRGKCEKFCPFYYNKFMKQRAHIILMPYNYLLQSSYLQQNGVNLRDSILIIDQAHNIQSVLQQSKQFSLTLSILSRALSQISQLHQLILSQQKSLARSEQVLKKSRFHINSSLESVQYHASYVTMVHLYFQMVDIPIGGEGKTFGIREFVEIMQEATKESQFGVITKRLKDMVQQLKNLRSDLLFRPFWALQTWGNFIQKVYQLYIIYESDKISSKYKMQLLYQGSDIKLNIFCLDPSSAMSSILSSGADSIILTSGTLSPIKSFSYQLSLSSISPASCPHILNASQCSTYILTCGPSIALNFSYQNRQNNKMYFQLGLVLTQIIKNTSNGVVIFFPSYSLMDQAIKGFNSNKIMAKIYQHKIVYVEKRDSQHFNTVIEGYLKDALKPKGAVLFALIRGKVSQGLDFRDQRCRAVVVVGVPYPARKDIKVVSKMQYLNQLSAKGIKDSLTGEQWYLSQAIRSINQGIGRIIRHKSDYGKIYLLDERYNKDKPDLKGQLSSWAKQNMKIITNYYDLADQFKRNRDQLMFIKPVDNKVEKKFEFGNLKSLSGKITKSQHPQLTQNQHNQNNQTNSKISSLRSMLDQIKHTKPKQQSLPMPLSRQCQIFRKTKVQFTNRLVTPIDMPKPIQLQSTVQQCPICRNNIQLIQNVACSHKICQECWKIWLKKDLRCPICRIRVRERFLITHDKIDQHNLNKSKEQTKQDQLVIKQLFSQDQLS